MFILSIRSLFINSSVRDRAYCRKFGGSSSRSNTRVVQFSLVYSGNSHTK